MFDHNECRKKVCVICTKKATRTRPLSSTDLTSLKTYISAEFNHDDPDYPCGICNGCYLLRDKKRNGNDVQLPVNQTYKSGKKCLRSDGLICHCIICTVASSFGAKVANSKKKCGYPKSESETIPQPATIKVCSHCYENIYAGCRHKCSENSYQRKKVYNLEKLIATPITSERLASRAITKCSDDMGFPH